MRNPWLLFDWSFQLTTFSFLFSDAAENNNKMLLLSAAELNDTKKWRCFLNRYISVSHLLNKGSLSYVRSICAEHITVSIASVSKVVMWLASRSTAFIVYRTICCPNTQTQLGGLESELQCQRSNPGPLALVVRQSTIKETSFV